MAIPEDVFDQLFTGLFEMDCPFFDKLTLESVTEPGDVRYHTLEWLFDRFDSEIMKLPQFAKPDYGETEADREQRLTKIANFLGLCSSRNTKIVQGERGAAWAVRFVVRVLKLVDIAQGDEKGDKNIDKLFANDVKLLSHIAKHRSNVFAEHCHLFPQADLIAPAPRYSDEQLSEVLKQMQKKVKEIESMMNELDDIDQESYLQQESPMRTMGLSLRRAFSEFHSTVSQFNQLFNTELRSWISPSQPTIGIGVQAERVLKLFKRLSEFIDKTRITFHSMAALADSSKAEEAVADVQGVLGDDAVYALKDDVLVLEQSVLRRKLMTQ